jgi:hypothetical protein
MPAMRYRLRTLLIVLAIGPMVLAGAYFYGLPLERWFEPEPTPGEQIIHHSVTTTTVIDLRPMLISGGLLLIAVAVVFVSVKLLRRASNT